MPIKPENKALYPADWLKVIRPEVLARDRYRCKTCGVDNGAVIIRSRDRLTYQDLDGRVFCAETSERRGYEPIDKCGEPTGPQAIKVVLTIAHLDGDPTNNGEPGNRPNLAALCQMHHLRLDAAQHAESARKTRDAKKGQGSLF